MEEFTMENKMNQIITKDTLKGYADELSHTVNAWAEKNPGLFSLSDISWSNEIEGYGRFGFVLNTYDKYRLEVRVSRVDINEVYAHSNGESLYTLSFFCKDSYDKSGNHLTDSIGFEFKDILSIVTAKLDALVDKSAEDSGCKDLSKYADLFNTF